MPCYHPLKGWQSRSTKGIVFNPKDGYVDRPMSVPCGQCYGCRLERSRQWAMRCLHEASLYENNCFITLTYNKENLPEDGSLKKEHFQKFMKRLRKRFPTKKIRYYHCGEYGEKNFRPHYHAIIFNLDFNDKELYTVRNGENLYTSKTLEKLWPFGFSTLGSVTFESAAYVARYVMKKITGKGVDEKNDDGLKHYERVDADTGEILELTPEYNTMSRRPGIGADWFKKYKNDCYPKDFVTIRGKKMKPPKFYDTMLEKEHADFYQDIKNQRIKTMKKFSDDNTADRLLVKEVVAKAKTKTLIRSLDQ